MKAITRNLITGLGLVTFAASANGAAIIYEPFNQADGAVGGQVNLNGASATTGGAGQTGLTGNWGGNGSPIIVETPLAAMTAAYGSLEHAGGQMNMPNNAGGDAFVTTSTALGTAGLLANGATLWFSFMYTKDANGGSNEQSGFAFGTERIDGAFNGANMLNSGNGLGAFTRGDTVTAGRWSGGGNVNTTGAGSLDIAPGLSTLPQTVFIVGKMVWGATVSDVETITLYLKDTSAAQLAIEPTTGGASQTLAGVDQTAFDTISFTNRNSGGNMNFDEIRFGATYGDVSPVPEPSAALLGGLGFLALLRRRR